MVMNDEGNEDLQTEDLTSSGTQGGSSFNSMSQFLKQYKYIVYAYVVEL